MGCDKKPASRRDEGGVAGTVTTSPAGRSSRNRNRLARDAERWQNSPRQMETERTEYGWNMADGNLSSVSSNGVPVTECWYDSYGRRIAKREGGWLTLYLWDGMEILAVADGGGNLREYYTRGTGVAGDVGSLAAETRFGGGEPETVFLHADWRGGVVLATDAAGNAVGRYGYSAYGEPFAADSANRYAPRFGFSSKGRDASGLVYYGFRHASPELCRWITPDPARESGGLNLYAFCGGNPICYVDEEGEIILQVVVVAFAAYTIYQLLQKFVNSAIGLGTAYHKIQLASQRLCVLRETEQYEEIKEVYSEIINNTGECAKIAAENLPVVSFALRSGGGIIKPQPHYDAPVLEQSLTGRFKYKKINGYLRKDGKYVPPHYRRFPRKKTPDGIPFEPEMPKPNNTLYPR